MTRCSAFPFIFIFVPVCLINPILSANVLCMFTSSALSQLTVFMAVANTLIDRDHNVTVVTTIPIPPTLGIKKPFRHIHLEQPLETRMKLHTSLAHYGSGTLVEFYAQLKYLLIANMFPKVQRDALTQQKFQDFLQEDNHFDLMLLGYFHNDFVVGVGAHFGCPIAVISLGSPFGPISRMVGNPDESTYVQIPVFGRTQPLSFTDRMVNFLWTVVNPFVQMYVDWIMEGHYKVLFPDEFFPRFSDMITNISLVLCNSHFSEMPIQPLVPAVVEIGGIQIRDKPDPLPEDIQDFLDSSVQGTILFSIGSKIRGTYLKPGEFNIIFNILSKLDERVLWEWEEPEAPPNTHGNIYFRRSLPIDDILLHPSIKLLITDGRPQVCMSGLYRGIPMLGMPLYADEPYYVAEIINKGFGVSVDINTLTEDSFQYGLTKVLENTSYRRNAKYFSDLHRDRPLSARETAAFWLEYVIRHRGALHMQSHLVHMDIFQRWNIDVIAVLYALYYLVKKLIRIVVFGVRVCLELGAEIYKNPGKYKKL